MQLLKGVKAYDYNFPTTRYQGCKQKIVEWIWKNISHLEFDTFLDAFSGTSCVGFNAKKNQKEVTCNDILKFNYQVALAIIENSTILLTDRDIEFILTKQKGIDYPTFIQDTFKDIYYTDEENSIVDMIVTNINQLEDQYKKAIAFAALGQACLVKRPFNLFHRKNLYVRFADVPRSFGNKTTWDKPFQHYFRKFSKEFNDAVFSNGKINKALNCDVFDIPDSYDMVYIDTPYVSPQGGGVDYQQFYHFLDGIVDYKNWHDKIDLSYKHRPFKSESNVWVNKNEIEKAFDRLFKKYQDSILVVSYRSPGIPEKEVLINLLEQYKQDVVLKDRKYKYVLSKEKENKNGEVLLIAK
ncbi:MAG: DNA methyltransferase [Candidatus Methanoperedenaceae archaeon HGW-Methanoperedenaceae-1]|nr:MAG: DNA methyltransferase [Candidatus Methanoperedenaceae archaeon HGW-Methanoperedenaceae-1]